MKKIIPLLFILILSTGFFTGCKKDKGEPPVLPPQESMNIDFTNFISVTKSAVQKGTANSNCRDLESDYKYNIGGSCSRI
jgi:hypothetical protein